MLSLALGVGVMVSQSWAARDALFWTETPPTQVPVVQVPNWADMAEYLKPSAVNMSTTQIVRGPRRTMPRMPHPLWRTRSEDQYGAD